MPRCSNANNPWRMHPEGCPSCRRAAALEAAARRVHDAQHDELAGRARDDVILSMYREGATVAEIKREVGMSDAGVRGAIKRLTMFDGPLDEPWDEAEYERDLENARAIRKGEWS